MEYCTANLIGQQTPKISHVASGTTPNKPTEKLARDSRRNIRGPLDFSSENVENLENLEPLEHWRLSQSEDTEEALWWKSDPGIKVT